MSFHGFDGGTRGQGGVSKSSGVHSYTRPMSDINVTPLVDVMLVLLVIFIITAPLMSSSIRLDLPQTAAARPSESERKVTLVVAPSGDVSIDDTMLGEPALLARLRTVAQSDPDTEVQLRADANVPYGRVVQLIGLAQQAGLSRVGFVAEPGYGAAKP
jgi:biopolymer transport protein TolR